MNVQLEMGTFAETASASTRWGPSSAGAMRATRWLPMAGPVWISMNVLWILGNVRLEPVRTWMAPTDAFARLGIVYSRTNVKISMSASKNPKSVPWGPVATPREASNVCVQKGSPSPQLEEGAKICE